MGWWNTAAEKKKKTMAFFFLLPSTLQHCALAARFLRLLHPHMPFFCSAFSRFLYFEYNEIREVDPGTFDSMPSLQLVFLNANLLRSLPLGVFSKVNLARLNLRNNHLLHLPMAGVLEHLTGLVQVGPPTYSFCCFKKGISACLCECARPGRHLKE